MVKLKNLISVFALLFICTALNAGLIEMDSTTNSSEWVSGSDSTGSWYSSDYSVDSGAATLTESSCWFSSSGTSSLLYAISLNDVSAGSYSWSIDTKYVSYFTQYNYGQVYLVKDGKSIDLSGKSLWGKSSSGTKIISQDYPGILTGGENWTTFGSTFTLTEQLLKTYDSIAFVFSGSKSSWETLQYANFSTDIISTKVAAPDVPEPATFAILGTGAIWLFNRKRKKS